MSETPPTENEKLDQSFNDDFDFGEAETESRPKQKVPAAGLNKMVLFIVFLIVFSVIGIMGYKIFKAPIPSSPLAHPNTIEASLAKPNPAPNKTTVSPPSVPNTKSTHAPATGTTDQNFNDIAAAFSSTEPSVPAVHPTPTAAPSTTVTSAPAKATIPSGSIQELQKDLFAPEQIQQTENAAPATNSTSSPGVAGTNSVSPDVPTQNQAAELNQGLNKLNHQIDYILNQIKYLDSYTREVSDNLNKLNDSISTMDSRLLALTNTTSTLSKDVGTVRNEVGHVKQVLKDDGLDVNLGVITQKKKPNPQEGKITIEEPEYVVHAVIPGRAWLKSSKGQIVTVAEGDTIGNYGKILVIDAANGVVLTSSGIAFR